MTRTLTLLIPYDENLPVYSSCLYYQSFQKKIKNSLFVESFSMQTHKHLKLPTLILCGIFSLIGNLFWWAGGNVCRDFIATMKRKENKSGNWLRSVHLTAWWTPQNCNTAKRNSNMKLFSNINGWEHGGVACCAGSVALSFKRNSASKCSYICTEDTWHLSEHLLCVVTCSFKVQLKNAVRTLDIHLNIPLF